jgi:hypothetical protein
MVHHFNHRYGDFRDKIDDSDNTSLPDIPASRLADRNYTILPRFWVPAAEVDERLRGRWNRGWLLGWRDICRSTDERTVIATVIPRAGVGNQYPVMLIGQPELGGHLAANLSSFALDFASRQKVGGTHLNFFVYEQLPVLPPAVYSQPAAWQVDLTVGEWMRPRILELYYTAWDLEPFARDLGYDGPPFGWDPQRRRHLRSELDAAFLHLYGIARDEASYMLETFPIVRANDEKEYGLYSTKVEVLKCFDTLQGAPADERGGSSRATAASASPAIPRQAGG